MRPIRTMGDWGSGCCLAGGDSYGASLSSSSSSAASLSGATDVSNGANYGGTQYGPGSLVNLINKNASGANLSTPVIIAVIIGAVLLLYFLKRK